MISYDNYKNRIEKLAKAKRIAHKFRFLIAGALTLIIGASVGLMLAKGAYMSATVLSAQSVKFNEEFTVTPAKAFLSPTSSQKIEYCTVDDDGNAGEWSTEKPVKAGNYLVRTVSPKIVGYSYSTPVSLVIERVGATFAITGDSVVYGDTPQYSATQLVSGHRVDEQSLEFDYADYGAATTQVDVVQSSVKIIDADGEDFTSCYDIEYSGRELNVTNRKMTVKPEDKTVTYDGTEQSFDMPLEEGNLAKGDKIIFETAIIDEGARVHAVTDAGKYTVELSSITVMHGSIDVTARYDITRLTSQFVVEKRKISVTTESMSKTYDGTPLVCTELVGTNLAAGHNVIVTDSPSITNVGTVENRLSCMVIDGHGADVSENYETPVFTYGTLEVKPCEVTVKTANDSRIYNGTALCNFGFTLGGTIPEGFTFREIENAAASITDYGTVQNAFEVYVTDAYGENVTENFKLSYEYGTLKIDKRPITVMTGSAERVFNNQPLSSTDCAVVDGETVSGQQLEYDSLFSVTNVTAAGGVDNTTTFKVYDGFTDVSNNYTITYVYGKLTVNVRRIVVYTDDGGRIYDGTPYSNSGNRTVWEEDENEVGLITGELTVVSAAEITHVGTIDNKCEYSLADGNYAIAKVVPGTLTITARPIVVVTKSDSKVYDGTALSAPEYIHTYLETDSGKAGLIGEDMLTLVENSAPSITNFGATDNTVLFAVPNTDYEIKDYDLGIISILQRHIIVTTATDEKEYDGDPLENTNYEHAWADDTTKVGLIGDDELINFSATKVTQVGGPVANACDYYLPLFDGVSSNYVIDSYVYGTLTITPRPIMVVTESDSKPYDGTPLSKTDDYNVYYAQQIDGVWTAVTDGSVAGLIGDDELTLTYTAEITDFGTADNACTYKHENIYGRSNYDIHYTYGTLEITVRKIIVVTSSDSKVYDGQPLTAATYDYTYIDGDPAQSGLLGEDKLTLVAGSAPSITNYGSVTNNCRFTVPNTNYEIVDYDDGTLEITQRHITVTTETEEKVYDGTALSNAGYTTALSSDPEKAGLIGNDKLTVTGNPSITDVGAIENKAESYTLPEFEAGKSNYVIDDDGYVYGTLTVTVRTLSITTGSASKEYDGTPLTQTTVEKCVYIDEDGAEFTGLVLDHKLRAIDATITSQTAATGADGVDNTTEYEVVDGIGTPINNNYEIEYVAYGKLVITRAALTVTPYSYDGSEDNKPALTYGDIFVYETSRGNYISVSGLVNGEQLEIAVLVYADTTSITPITPVNAGTYYLAIDIANCIVYDKYGNEIANGIDNYTVSKTYSALIILRKEINVVIDNQNCDYGDDIPENDFTIYEADGITVIENGRLSSYNETLSLTYAYAQGESAIDEPKNAGDYQISATAAAINGDAAGVDNYKINLTDGTLTIAKLEIEFKLVKEEMAYGITPSDSYSLIDSGLQYDDVVLIMVKYVRDSVEYKTSDRFNVGEYEVIPVSFNIYDGNFTEDKLLDSGAGDALKNYIITCSNGVLEVTPKEITIVIASTDCTYGEDLPDLDYDVYEYDFDGNEMLCETLPYEDALAVAVKYLDKGGNEVETPKNAGVYTIAFDSALINLDEEGLKNYKINADNGTLTIKPKAISLYVDPKSAVYGNDLPENSYRIVGQLVEGDKITLVEYRYEENTENGKVYDITPKNFGTYYISIITVMINGVEIPVSYVGDEYYNYAIAVNNAELKITPRPVTVELSPVKNVLYGATFEYADSKGNYANTPDLAYGEQLKVAVKYYDKDGNEVGTPKNADTYSAQIDLEGCVFYDKDGEVIEGGLSNYKVSCDALENLEIGKRALIIKPLSFTSENGNAVIYGEFEQFTYPTGKGNYATVYINNVATENIPYGEQFEVTLVTFYLNGLPYTPKNVGICDINTVMSGVLVYDEDGNLIANGLDNYDITKGTVSGDFEIVAREITAELEDVLKVVYGNSYAYPDGIGNYKAVYTTAYGEQLKFTVKYTDGDGNEVADPKNAGIYNIVPVSFTVYDSDGVKIEGGENNYNLTDYTAGTLEIVPLEIGVRFDYPEITYGEDIPTELKLEGLYTVSYAVSGIGLSPIDGLPYGDTIAFDFEYGTFEDYSSSSDWFGDDGYGIFTPVTPHNAGTYVMVITNVYINGGDCSNYKIFIDTPCLTVWERDITFELNAISNVTYGATFEYADAVGNYTGTPDLQYGEKLQIVIKYLDKDGNEVGTPKNAGIYSAQIDLENCVVYDKDGKVIEGGINNYKVTCDALENLEILQKKLYIVIDNQGQNGEIIYGDELPANTFKIYDSVLNGTEIVNGELPYDETIDFVFEYRINDDVVTPKNAGDYTIWFDYTKPENIIINGVPYGSDDEKNYLFAVSAGKLTISKKTLDITLTDFTLTYGDKSHITDYINDAVSNPYFATNAGEDITLEYGEKLYIAVKYYDKDGNEVTPKNVGEYTIRAYSFDIKAKDNAVIESGFEEFTNYIINCGDGKLTIDPKEITVEFDDAECIYGDDLPAISGKITAGLDENGKLPYDENYSVEGFYVDSDGLYQPDAGSYAIVFDCLYDRENLTEADENNYKINVIEGTLTVKERNVRVVIPVIEVEYGDAIEDFSDEIKVEVLDKDGAVLQDYLPYKEKISLTFKYTQNGKDATPDIVGDYIITFDEITVSGGNYRVENYNFTTDGGTLKVTKKVIKVEIDDARCEYGEDVPHSTFKLYDKNGAELENGKLPNDESIDFVYRYIKGEVSTLTPTAAGVYSVEIDSVAVSGGNADADNYDVTCTGKAPLLEIKAKEIKIYLSGGVAPRPFVYGEDYDTVICNAKIEGLLDGQTIDVAVIYTAVTSTESARAARAFALRLSASGFIPRNVGTYKAELDWDNCRLVASDGTSIDGGMDNYVLADGFDCQPVTFEIVQKKITVTIADGSTSVYGDKLQLDKIGYSLDVQPAEGESLELTFAVLDGENAAKNVGDYPITIAEKAIAGGSIDNYEIVIAETNPVHTITARDINVVLTNQFVTFGDTPAYPEAIGNYDNIDNLADGEALKVFVKYTTLDGQPVENPTVADTYYIVIDRFEVYADGKLIENGFKNYEVLSVSGTLEISGRVITIKTGDADKIYDGTALTSDGYVIVSGELPEGYTIGVKTYFEQTNATAEDGVDNKTEFEVLYKGEPTENFVIGCNEYGKFTVTPRPIKVETLTDSKDYDGTALTAGYVISYNGEGEFEALGSGDSFAVTQSSSITDKGNTANTIRYIITNANREDVTSVNYTITYVEGTLTVNALRVEVTLDNVSVQYGEKFSVPVTLDCGALPNGEQLSFDVVYSNGGVAVTPDTSDSRYFVLAVGTYTMTVDTTTIKVDGEETKAGNYEFVFPANSASLTITARKIIVTTATDSKTYDGNPLTNTGVDNVVWAKDGSVDGLIGGDVLTVDNSVAPASVTNVGDPIDNIVKYIAPANYEIVDTLYGKLSIDSKQITVKTDNIDGEYNGNAYSSDGYFLSSGNLVYGHELQVDTLFERTDATEDGKVKNTTTFKVVDAAGIDVTGNYDIDYENGTVIIKRMELTVKTADITADYDGSAHYSDLFDWVGEARPVLGHTLAVSQLYTCTNATTDGSKQNTTTFKVVDADGNDVNNNYNVVVAEYGTVTINPAKVSITLADVSTDYGDASYNAKLTAAATVTGIVRGQSLNLAFDYSDSDKLPNAGTYTATLVWDSCTVTGGNLANYTLISQPADATLTINRKSITVTVESYERDYGYVYSVNDVKYGLSESLRDGESLELNITVTDGEGNAPVNKGEYAINATVKAVNGGSLDNYDIVIADNNPTLTINAKVINITLDDLSLKYAETVVYPDGAGNYKSLTPSTAFGEAVEVLVDFERNGSSVTPVFAGEYDIVLTGIKVYASNGTLIDGGDGNYDFSGYTRGTLTIDGIELVVTRFDVTKTYDGTPLTLSQTATADEISFYYFDADGNKITELPDGYSIVLTNNFATTTANVQTIANGAEYDVYKNGAPSGEFSVTYNPDQNGSLIIEPRRIIVVTAGDSKVYDGTALTKTDDYRTYLDGDRTAAGLLDNDKLKVVEAAELVNADTVDNSTEYAVPEFVVGSSNYVIVGYEYGKLTVTKRQIVITTATDSHVYDGSAFSNPDYTTVWADDGVSAGLIGGDRLTLKGTAASITAIGTVQNVCEYTLPEFAAGMSNYEVYGSVNYGTLTVTVRNIVVVTASDSKEYDGTALTNASYVSTYLQGEEGTSGLLDGDVLTLDASAAVPAITNVGTLENGCKFTVPNGNYVIVGYDCGTLEITPKAIDVTLTMNDSYVYGDESVKNFGVAVSGLVDGESLSVKLIYTLNGVTVSEPKAAGVYTAELDIANSVCTANNGTGIENGIGNYDISCEAITFEITKKDITLTLDAWSDAFYNGKAQVYGGSWTVAGLEYGEEITSLGFKFYTDAEKTDEVSAPVNAGKYYVVLDSAKTILDTLAALSANYNVADCNELEFNVLRSDLTVTLSTDLTQTYNGTEFSFGSATDFTAAGLAEGEKLTLTVRYEADGEQVKPVNAGSYDVIVEDIAIAGNANGMDNYNLIACTDGKLEIARRAVSVVIADRVYENGEDKYSEKDITALPSFVGNDLATAFENGELAFTYTDLLPLPAGASSQYTVSLAVNEGEVMSNYEVKVTDGTLIVTKRHVIVAPEYKGTDRLVYTGSAVSADLFGFIHTHASDSEFGFEDEDLDSITAVYTFTNMETNVSGNDYPTAAGTYKFTVALSGDGTNDYYIEYSGVAAVFTIERRTLDLSISYDGEMTFVYSGEMPQIDAQFSVINTDTTDGLADGDGDDMAVALSDGNTVGKFYAVGKYSVSVDFANIENYEINVYYASPLSIEIVKRTIVVAPTAPEAGLEQYYNGESLKLGSNDYVMYSDTDKGVYPLVNGDTLEIISNEITVAVRKGWVTIQKVIIMNSRGDDVTANYDVHSNFASNDPALQAFGLNTAAMRLYMSFKQFELHYNQVIDGAELSYTGAVQTYDIRGTAVDDAISVVGDVNLYSGHRFAFSSTAVSVSANAGTYAGWLSGVLTVVDEQGTNVTALYSLVCDNANDDGKPIVVTKNTLTITLSGVTQSALDNGENNGLFVSSDLDGITVLNPANYTVSGLLEENGVAVHSVEIAVFNIKGRWLLGVVVYRKNNTVRVDVSANYDINEIAHDDGFDVQPIAVSDIATLSKPILEVSIDLTLDDIVNGYGTLYAPSDVYGSMQLTGGYSVDGLQDGHNLGIFVFRDGGSYILGVCVYSVSATGSYVDAISGYNYSALPEIAGMSVKYVRVANLKSYARDLYLDLSGAFTANGDGSYTANADENGAVPCNAIGLITGDICNVTVADGGNGTFELTVKVVNSLGTDKTAKYYVPQIISATLPVGATVTDNGNGVFTVTF